MQQRRSQNRRVLLLIDDAHNFKAGALEEIERLLAFKIDKKPALELLLAGPRRSPSTGKTRETRLEHGDVLVHGLMPASQEDLTGYLDWRLGRFDMQNFMTPVALQMIARLSGGRYAAADVLCQMSLLLLRQLSSSEQTRASYGKRSRRWWRAKAPSSRPTARAMPSNGSMHRRRDTSSSAAAARC